MKDKCFVDTNILVYAHDISTGEKHERAKALISELWASGTGLLSTQVLQELCVTLRRKPKRPLSVDDLRRMIEDYLSWQIIVNTPASAVEALEMGERYEISFWDALILSAAENGGASVLYSEDLTSGRIYGSVRVVNPFL